jgi:hypothetical protein
MNTTDDLLRLVRDLKPVMLDRLADEGYARRRRDDLARVTADPARAPARGPRLFRGPGRRWRPVALGLAMTTAAAGLAAGVLMATSAGHPVLPGRGHHAAALPAIRLTDAQRVVYRLSSAAAAAPQLTGRYIELTEIDIFPGERIPGRLRKTLARIKNVPALRSEYLGTLKAIKELGSGPQTIQRTSVIESRTGDTWTYQHGRAVPAELPVARHGSPTKAEFAGWPTQPAALRGLLLTQARRQPQGRGETPDDLVFQQASNWLWNPLVSPALRSALYKVLAATPGVVVRTHARDATGRPAVEISRSDSAARQDIATFENPATGAVLESSVTGAGAGTEVYESVTSHATLPASPYGR